MSSLLEQWNHSLYGFEYLTQRIHVMIDYGLDEIS